MSKAGRRENTVKHANVGFFRISIRFKNAADKIFSHVLFILPFKMYKTSLCSTLGFCTRIQQIAAKGLFIRRKHVFAPVTMLEV